MKAATIPKPIGDWTAQKLEYLDYYLQAYRTVTKGAREAYYIDLFSGCGDCIRKRNGYNVAGSPWRALRTIPPFQGYFFVEEIAQLANHLNTRIQQQGIQFAKVLIGDCNGPVLDEVLSGVPKTALSFAFLDPSGLQLYWPTVEKLAAHRIGRRKMELLILYPYQMVIRRFISNPQMRQAFTLFFGGDSWIGEYEESIECGEDTQTRRKRFVELYKNNLKSLNYKFVDDYGPLGHGNRYYYHVIFASDEDIGQKIMKDVWSKPRLIPGQLGYEPIKRPR